MAIQTVLRAAGMALFVVFFSACQTSPASNMAGNIDPTDYPLAASDARAQLPADYAAARPVPLPRFPEASRATDPAEEGVKYVPADHSVRALGPASPRAKEVLPPEFGPLPKEGRNARGTPGDGTTSAEALSTTLDTTAWPYRGFVKVYIQYPAGGGLWVCSGSMIGARSVLTAGHCAYNKDLGGWASWMRVVPAQDGNYMPFGDAYMTHLYSVTGWTQSGSRESDYAMITLDRSLGNATGWFGLVGLSVFDSMGTGIRMDGYPATGPYPRGDLQVSGTGSIQLVWTTMYFWDLESYGGFSGSGVRRTSAWKDYVAAINTASNCGPYRACGTRITSDRLNQIVGWMQADAGLPSVTPDQSNWHSLAGMTMHTVVPVATSTSRMDLLVRGLDGQVYQDIRTDSGDTGWMALGGYVMGEPAAVSRAANQLDIFAVGGDGAVYTKAHNADGSYWPSWNGWYRMPGAIEGVLDAPAAAASGPYRLDVFAVSTSGKLYWQYWPAPSGWSGWQQLAASYRFDGSPAAISSAPGRVDVVARTTSGALFNLRCSGACSSAAWFAGPVDVSPGLTVVRGRPVLASSRPNQIDLFIRSDWGSLLYGRSAGGGWGWTPAVDLGGLITDDPSVASRWPGILDVFVRGDDGAIYTKAFDGSNWLPSKSGYWWLGGNTVGTPSVVTRSWADLDVFSRDGQRLVRTRFWRAATGWYVGN